MYPFCSLRTIDQENLQIILQKNVKEKTLKPQHYRYVMDSSQDELYRKFIEAISSSFTPHIAISPLDWGNPFDINRT